MTTAIQPVAGRPPLPGHAHAIVAFSGFDVDPRYPRAIGDRRAGSVAIAPGTHDSRNGTRAPLYDTAMGRGVQTIDAGACKRMAAAVEQWGVVGSRVRAPDARGHASLPFAATPAGPFLQRQRDTLGDYIVYGSPVTNMSARAEAQMAHGGRCPETGALEVRRHTTTMLSPHSEITPGASGRRTAGYTVPRGAVKPLPGTPALAGVSSLVEGMPPPSHGRFFAVGTESFGTPGSTGGPMIAQPREVAAVPVPRPGGVMYGTYDYALDFPGYTPGEKGGVAATWEPPPSYSASLAVPVAAPAKAPTSPLVVAGIALLALVVLGGKKR